jgi:hypothetical protein
MLNGSVTHLGVAAVYAAKSKYKAFWALILAGGDRGYPPPHAVRGRGTVRSMVEGAC